MFHCYLRDMGGYTLLIVWKENVILLMAEILYQLIGTVSLSYYIHIFIVFKHSSHSLPKNRKVVATKKCKHGTWRSRWSLPWTLLARITTVVSGPEKTLLGCLFKAHPWRSEFFPYPLDPWDDCMGWPAWIVDLYGKRFHMPVPWILWVCKFVQDKDLGKRVACFFHCSICSLFETEGNSTKISSVWFL